MAIAVLIDLVYGEPPLVIHPVVICGKIASKFTKPYGSKIYGIFLWIISVIPLLMLFYMLEIFTRAIGIIIYIIVMAIILKTSFSIGLMNKIVRNAMKYVKEGNWHLAKENIQQLVRRNVFELDEEHTLSACIESIAESLVDGVVGPLFYYPILGVLGTMLQRLANTMDSMVGYKTPEYKNIGWFSAKIDTILNFIPARLTALMIILASLILKLDWRNSLKIALRDHSKTASINAGWPMSAMAGALGVQLEKIGHYRLGDKIKIISIDDVEKALKIYNTVSATFILLIALFFILASLFSL